MTTDDPRWRRLGEIIVERRLALGWNQQRFSVAAQVSPQVISDLENGRRDNYDVPTLVKVQIALGWAAGSIQDILAGGQPTERPSPSRSA